MLSRTRFLFAGRAPSREFLQQQSEKQMHQGQLSWYEAKVQAKKPMPQLVTEHLKKPKNSQSRGATGKVPEISVIAKHLRPRLPHAWQYGWRFTSIVYTIKASLITAFSLLAKKMLYDPYTDEYKQRIPRYEFVKNEDGRVVGMAPERVVRQINKVKERSKRWRDECDEITPTAVSREVLDVGKKAAAVVAPNNNSEHTH